MPVGMIFSSLGCGLKAYSILVALENMELGAWPKSPEMKMEKGTMAWVVRATRFHVDPPLGEVTSMASIGHLPQHHHDR